MGIFRNLLLRDERAIAKVALDAHVNDAGLFLNFNSACEFFAKLGMTPDQARDAASKCGLQDGVLCTKAQEEIPEAVKPQFQQPGKPGVMPNASLGMAGTPQPTPTNADGATEKPPVEPVKQPAPSTPAVQPQEPAPKAPVKPEEPKHEPLPPEQKARLEAAQDMLGIDDPVEAHPEKPAKPVQAQPAAAPQPAQVQQAAPAAVAAPAPAQPAEVVKAMSLLCKDIFEGDNRGITDFENREGCLASLIQDEGLSFDEAQDRCNELAASADWDDDLYKSIDPAMGSVLISDVLNKARETGGEILRVPLAVIAKICPACGEKMSKSNLKVLKIRLTAEDAELRKAIMDATIQKSDGDVIGEFVAKDKDAKGHGSEKRGTHGGKEYHFNSVSHMWHDENGEPTHNAGIRDKLNAQSGMASSASLIGETIDGRVLPSVDYLKSRGVPIVRSEVITGEGPTGGGPFPAIEGKNRFDFFAPGTNQFSPLICLFYRETGGKNGETYGVNPVGDSEWHARTEGISKSGTSEGVKRSWETRRGGGAADDDDKKPAMTAQGAINWAARQVGGTYQNQIRALEGLRDSGMSVLKDIKTINAAIGQLEQQGKKANTSPSYTSVTIRDEDGMVESVIQGRNTADMVSNLKDEGIDMGSLKFDENGSATYRRVAKSASDVIGEFVAKAGTSEGAIKGWQSRKIGIGEVLPNGTEVRFNGKQGNVVSGKMETGSGGSGGQLAVHTVKVTHTLDRTSGAGGGKTVLKPVEKPYTQQVNPSFITTNDKVSTPVDTKSELPNHREYQRDEATGYIYNKLKNDKSEGLKRSVLGEVQRKFDLDAEDVVRVKNYFADEYGWDLSTGGIAKSGTSEGVKLSWEKRRAGLQAASENAKSLTRSADNVGTEDAHNQAREANRGVMIDALEAKKDAPTKAEKLLMDAVAMEHESAARHHSDAAEPAADKPGLSSERAKEVATTILDQLGGRKFSVMTGAKNFASHPEGALSFRLPGGGFTKDGINHVKITLTPADTYDIAYGKVRGATFKVVKESKGLYADDLRSNFRENTGLETSLGTMGVSKVDQRPTEAERNEVISEKWASDVEDTSATANKPDNETFTMNENVGIGKAQDIISEFVAKAGTSEGARKGAETKRAGGGVSQSPTLDRVMSSPDFLATEPGNGGRQEPVNGTAAQTGKVDYVSLQQRAYQSADKADKYEKSGDTENAMIWHSQAANHHMDAHLQARRQNDFGNADEHFKQVGVHRNAYEQLKSKGYTGVGKALGLASAVVMVAKGFADRKCECGAKMYKNPLNGEYECPECDAEDLEKASPEAKHTTGGAFNGGNGAEKEASCIPYMVAKGYSEQSAKRICGQVAQHIGKNVEETELMIIERLSKTAEMDGSHRVGQPLVAPLGDPGRIGSKPSEQDKMGVEGTGNTGAANISTEGDDALVDALESVCADCGANSAKTGLDLDTDVKLNGKDVKKSCGKCAKCGGQMVAKEDDDADDVEKTITDFIAKDKDAGGHGSFKRGTELHPDDQKHVLNAYVHRFTKEHKPQWTNEPRSDGTAYMPQHASDADWLQNTTFKVKNDGRLDSRVKQCHSTPTWPDGQDEKPVAKSVGLLGRMSAIVKSGGQA